MTDQKITPLTKQASSGAADSATEFACENTDRHLWPATSPFGAPEEKIFVTATGGIGINVSGSVYVKPLKEWHRLAGGPLSIHSGVLSDDRFLSGVTSEPLAASAPAGDAVAWQAVRLSDGLRCGVTDLHETAAAWRRNPSITVIPLYARPQAPAVEVREGWRYEIQHGPDSETDYAWVYDDKNNMVCTTKTHHAMAIVAARGGISLDASDVHYLGAIKLRLERLYEENPNDCRLREHISDEVSWIDGLTEALSASPREMGLMSNLLAKIRALPVRKEYMGGQLHTYVLLDNVVALVEVAPMASGIKPGPSEPSPSSRSETAGERALSQAEVRAGINILLETIAAKFDGWATWDVWRSEAASLVRSFKHAPPTSPDCSGCKPGVQKEDATRIEGSMQSEGANAKSGGAV